MRQLHISNNKLVITNKKYGLWIHIRLHDMTKVLIEIRL